MCEFGSDDGVDESTNPLQILSKYPHLTRSFDTYDREEIKMNLSA
jgi:hypothetical protein